MLKIISILIICNTLFLQACSFNSQVRSKSPHFNGQLTLNNKAIVNAKIMLSTQADDKYCLKATKFTHTNKQGHFNLSAIIENYNYVPFADQQLDQWNVCAHYNNNTYHLYTNNHYGAGDVTGSVYLQCELALQPINKLCTTSH